MALLLKVFGDVVTRIACPDDNDFLRLAIRSRCVLEFSRVLEPTACECVETFDIVGELGLATVACGLNDVLFKLVIPPV